VLFFDRKPASEKPWTDKLWIYDLRTNQHFTLKERTLKRSDLDEFVQCFHAENRRERTDSERFKGFTYDDILKRARSISIFSGFGTSRWKTARIFPILMCWRLRSLKNWKRRWSNLRRLRRI
jgi:hypothetical protein